MGRKTLPGGGTPISIRVSEQLKDQLTKAAEGLGLTEHDTLRLAMQIGFKHFAAIDHDLAEAIMAKSGLLPPDQRPKAQASSPVKTGGQLYPFPADEPDLRVAEDAPAAPAPAAPKTKRPA